MPEGRAAGVRSRQFWLRAVLPLAVLAGAVIAAGPAVIQSVNQTLAAQAIANATDPATGALRIESQPMQCASDCGIARNKSRSICGGYLSAEQLRARNIPPPDGSCDAAMVASYSVCMAQCGFTVPNTLRGLRANELPPDGPPALGSPEELALRRGGR